MNTLVRHVVCQGAALATALFLVTGMVRADQPADGWITTKVKIALLSDDLVDGLDINVDTLNGKVTLQGKVASADEKMRAEERATDIEGVREVANMLAVVEPQEEEIVERADEELRREIETVLERDSALEDSDIEVASVNDGIVVISGNASSLAAHQRALEDVRAVLGVKQVSGAIEVPDAMAQSERPADTDKSEKSAKKQPDVAAAPASDRDEEGADIGDDIEEAPSEMEAAVSNAWTTTKVKMRLLSEAGISPFAINVDSRDGVVTLFGIVETDVAREQAAAEAAKVKGVREVANKLQVVPEAALKLQRRTDNEIYKVVKESFAESKELEDADIDIEVKNNVVRLTGTVGSETAHQAAVKRAKETPGVSSVSDELRIESAEAS